METLCHSEKREREPWLAHELTRLKQMYEAGESIPAIAAALGKPEIRVLEMRQRARIYRSPESAQAHANSASWIRISAVMGEGNPMTVRQIHEATALSLSVIRRELQTHRAEVRIDHYLRTPGRNMAVWALVALPASSTTRSIP